MSTSSLRVYLLFCVFRILNAFLIQSQFDPDEYWQNLEPAYCRVFGEPGAACPGLTWEWKRKPASTDIESVDDLINVGLEGPVRSYASILPTLLFYHVIKLLALDSTWMVSRGPVLLNAVIVAAPTDWSVWYMARWMQSPQEKANKSLAWYCSYCSMTSWFNAYALVRTYSNSIETVLLALGLVLVSPQLLGNPGNGKNQAGVLRACLAFFLGGISCAIRFTCLAAFVPLGILLALQRGRKSIVSIAGYLVGVCAVFGFAGLATTLLLDRFMYEFWAIPFLGNIHFNVILGHGSLYGTHPFHWYLTAGIPAITGAMLPFLIYDFCCRWNPGRRNLWVICLCYIVAHSYSEHKEFRFLLPLLPLFCLLASQRVKDLIEKTKITPFLLTTAGVLNLVAVLYLGLIHQRAPLDVNHEIVSLVKHEPQTYTVHYLMGCHSTPLLSHLHNPPIKFETWTLDCSPKCRSKAECESDKFSKDPGGFMENAYFHCSDFEVGTCVTDMRFFYPDFLVAAAGNLPAMRSRIAAMGMKEVGRYTLGINGLRIGDRISFGDDALSADSFSKVTMLSGLVVLSWDEIVLFANKDIKPGY